MIRIGLGVRDKQRIINEYIENHDINKVFCFYFRKFLVKFKTDIAIEYCEYKNIIEYKSFYHLLEVIDANTLLIFDECMRTQNRSDLTYNCAHHYCNQTPHKIIFEYFPIIDTENDFMILLDFVNKSKYKGKLFDCTFLQNEDIKIKPIKINLETINVDITDNDKKKYKKRKEYLFATLGEKDPDTIPRNLQLLAGDMKRKAIEPDKLYVARNRRFGMDNVLTYRDITGVGNYVVIDTHYRQLDFNDFLKTTQMNNIKYLSTVLPIDSVITTSFMKWKARIDVIYAQASLYK